MQVTGTEPVYKVVGGAPLLVSTWAAVGGPRAITPISAAQLAALSAVPATGSVVYTESGDGYVIAGGYPFALPSGVAAQNQPGAQLIDGWDIENLSNPMAHLSPAPGTGTVVEGMPSGSFWVFSGAEWSATTATSAAPAVADHALVPWRRSRRLGGLARRRRWGN